MIKLPNSSWALLGLWLAVAPAARAADPVITELMASNRGSRTDEDGETSDWLEIYHPGPSAISLEGWSLTDDPRSLVKWTFPGVTLDPGEFMIVYASGKDRRPTDGELHTNFNLNASGEYLALVDPEGRIAHEYEPAFPPQVPDVSHGPRMILDSESLVAEGATGRFLVPDDRTHEDVWFAEDFDDAEWAECATGVGFDTKSPPTFTPLISTDVETEMRGENSTIWVRIPFTLAAGSEGGHLELRLKYESGFVAWINGVEVLRRNVSGNVDYNTRASPARTPGEAVVFERFDLTPHAHLLRAGTNVLAIQGLNDNRSSSDFLLLPELDLLSVVDIRLDEPRFHDSPTPGWPNTSGAGEIAEEPRFSRSGGTFTGSVVVAMALIDSPAAEIRYTTDGSTPGQLSTLYTEPLTMTANTTIRARTFEAGKVASAVVENTYVALHSSAAAFSSDLPVMIVEAATRPAKTYIPAFWAVIDGDAGRNRITDPFTASGPGALRRRGSSSYDWPKNNFGLELRDETGDDRSTSLLGMPAESDWVLHGPYSDKSLMRNALSYQWSNDIGQYAPRTRFCELYMKLDRGTSVTQSHYWGVYLLVEKIKRDRNRVDIEELYPSQTEEPEISGGYLLKKDRPDPGDSGFFTSRGQELRWVTPIESNPTASEQNLWIQRWLNEFESVLFGADWQDPVDGYEAYIDVDAFIDHHIIVELTKNIDGYRLSTFMYKDRGGKLVMGPVWDYNLSLGNADYLNGWLPEGWYYSLISAAQYGPWYPRLFQDPVFKRRYMERWMLHRQGPLATERLLASVDRYQDILTESAPRNFSKWRVLGRYLWPNWYVARTWEQELDWMRGWIVARAAWMDSQLVVPPDFSPPGGPVDEGTLVELIASGGEIWYTLDGTDPQAAGGAPSATAILYEAPILIEANTLIQARTRLGGESWSPLVDATYATTIVPLAVTEVMYNPPRPGEGSEFSSGTDFEFLEIRNVGSEPIDLAGVRLGERMHFEFADGDVATLGAGEHVLVVRNRRAFEERYGDGHLIAGEYTGVLSNRSQDIYLYGPIGERLAEFEYQDSWYPETDGDGHSLELIDPFSASETWSDAASWRASEDLLGSPGRSGSEAAGGRVPGDLDEDGGLSIGDAVGLLGHLFRGSPARLPCGDGTLASPGNVTLLDANGDSLVNLSDPVHLLTYLFLGGGPHAGGVGCVAIPGCEALCDAS